MAITGLNSITSFTRATSQRVINAFPTMTVNSERANKAISWIGKKISSPENRLILGVTALMSQPFIDLNNKKVDEDTRKVSAARTVAKIIAGTSTGVLIRYACIKAIDAFTQFPETITATTKNPRIKTFFTPLKAISEGLRDLRHYKSALGTLVSLGVMVFTNFLVDAPFTKYMTNKFVDRIHQKDKDKLASQQGQKTKEVSHVA